MTRFILFAILCALIVIARELSLLRRQRDCPPSLPDQEAPQYTARVFTFFRSKWDTRITAANVFVTGFAGLLIWEKLIEPELPAESWLSQSWTRYLGAVVFGLVAIQVTEGILARLMKKHDEGVFGTQFSEEERELLKEMNRPERESMFREKGL